MAVLDFAKAAEILSKNQLQEFQRKRAKDELLAEHQRALEKEKRNFYEKLLLDKNMPPEIKNIAARNLAIEYNSPTDEFQFRKPSVAEQGVSMFGGLGTKTKDALLREWGVLPKETQGGGGQTKGGELPVKRQFLNALIEKIKRGYVLDATEREFIRDNYPELGSYFGLSEKDIPPNMRAQPPTPPQLPYTPDFAQPGVNVPGLNINTQNLKFPPKYNTEEIQKYIAERWNEGKASGLSNQEVASRIDEEVKKKYGIGLAEFRQILKQNKVKK